MIAFVNGAINGVFKTALCLLLSLAVLMLLSVGLNLDVPAVALFSMGTAGLLIAHMAVKNYSIENRHGTRLVHSWINLFYFVYDAAVLRRILAAGEEFHNRNHKRNSQILQSDAFETGRYQHDQR